MHEASGLLTEERRQRILAALQRDGKVRSAELSAYFGVSEDTVRRDLRELAEAGLLLRVHGGALRRTPTSPAFGVRRHEAPRAKEAIARAAAGLVQPGQVVVLDAGTTTLEVARRLPAELRATVVTNSPPIAVALSEHPQLDVRLLGGLLLKDAVAAVGAATVEALQGIHADICILGVAGVHLEAGVTAFDPEEAYVKRAMMAGAADVVAVAAADKLGTAVPFSVAPVAALTHIVTERGLPDDTLRPYRDAGVTVIEA